MTNVLLIMPDEPDEFGKGYQKLSFHRIQWLRNNFALKIVSVSPWLKFFDHLEYSEYRGLPQLRYRVGVASIAINLVICIFKFKPLQTALYTSLYLNSVLAKEPADITLYYLSRVYSPLNKLDRACVIEFVDSMYLNFSGRINGTNWYKSLVYKYESMAARRYESWIAEKVAMATAVSAVDANLIGPQVSVAPIGVDTVVDARCLERRSAIVFSGRMDYHPNKEAVLWFYYNVWRSLRRELPGHRFRVIGASPCEQILRLAKNDNTVEVSGFVESLVSDLFRSQISVAPMQSGSGMQFKIIEAMACGVPVVCTRKGLGDIRALPGKEIFLAETPNQFCSQIIKLINDEELSNRLSERGLIFSRKFHSWGRLNEKFEKCLQQALVKSTRI